MVKNVLVTNIDAFIDSLKRDLIMYNISNLIIYCGGYYELHLDGAIFRIFQSNLANTNTSDPIYDYIVEAAFKYISEYKNSRMPQISSNNNAKYKSSDSLSKKKVLKMTNARYKINDCNSIKLMRSKKLC